MNLLSWLLFFFSCVSSEVYQLRIVFVNIKGQTDYANIQRAKSLVFGNSSSSLSLTGHIKANSYGVNSLEVKIWDNFVYIPPRGKTSISNLEYDILDKCSYQLLFAYQEYAQTYINSIDPLFFNTQSEVKKRYLVVIPPNECTWYGLANDCYKKRCYIWIRGDRAYAMSTYIHEFGHTISLQHSSSLYAEYGDCSCPMGCSNSLTHYNAAQLSRLGWTKPLASLSYETMPAGQWLSYKIPCLQISNSNFVFISTSASSSNANIYVSFRCAFGYDLGLFKTYVDKISVHQYNGTNLYDRWRPNLVWGAGVNLQNYVIIGNIAMYYHSMNHNIDATIMFCRIDITQKCDLIL